LLQGDPLLESPWAPPGWFLGVEFDLVSPHITNHLTGTVTVTGFQPDTVQLPTAPLDWAGSPRLALGYRLPQGCGEILLTYRYLLTEGHEILEGFDLDSMPGLLKSRLDFDVIDLDYGSQPIPLGAHCDVKWQAGLRLSSLFFDSQAVGRLLEQRESNYFLGAGPHTAIDLRHEMARHGLTLFGRVECAAPWGRIHQNFEEVGLLGGPPVGAATLVEGTQVVPILSTRFGVDWSMLTHTGWLRLAFGYEWEHWWHAGRLGDAEAALTVQGLFFRAEYGF
jgi:hypothetical protein